MADGIRKPMLDRATALLVGPFLLGRRALDLLFSAGAAPPADPTPARPSLRPTVTPPEHAIKRRG